MADAIILVLNSGSSSIKTKLYRLPSEELVLAGELDHIGQGDGRFRLADNQGNLIEDGRGLWADHGAALQALFDRLGKVDLGSPIVAVGHRVVHGGQRFAAPARVTADMLDELRRLAPLDPLHLPPEIQGIEAVARIFPDIPQVACFDTAFHRTLPEVAWRYALPRRLSDQEVRRYGFHGLSYEYLVEELKLTKDRAILAHLGNGASMAAVRDGQCIDTTMGFTPTGGLVMGTRSGDLDPGILLYLLRERGISVPDLDKLLNNESGLLGVSGTTADMADLLRRENAEPAAALAVTIFCYQARKFIGALAAALGGLDVLVFTAGIGERSAAIREDIACGLGHLGVQLDAGRNAAGGPVISADTSRVMVRVVKTNEELMIARHTRRALGWCTV